MGGTEAKTTAESLTQVATDVATKTIMNCTSVASQSQMMNITTQGSLIGGSLTQTQGVAVNLDCVMSASTQNQIANDVAAKLAQESAAKGDAVLSMFGGSEASAASSIKQNISNNISNTTQQDMKSQITQQQSMNVVVGGSIIATDISQVQSASQTAKSLMQTSQYASVINDVALKMDQKTEATTTNPIASIISAFGEMFSKPMMIIAVVIVVMIVVALIFFVMK